MKFSYIKTSINQTRKTADLQFSTDDEEFEEVAADFETTTATQLGQGEGLARSAQPINYQPGWCFVCVCLMSMFQ